MEQDRHVQSHWDLRPERFNCNLTVGVKIAREVFVSQKEDYWLAREGQKTGQEHKF